MRAVRMERLDEKQTSSAVTVTSVRSFTNTRHRCPDNSGLTHPASCGCEIKPSSIVISIFEGRHPSAAYVLFLVVVTSHCGV